MMAGKHCDDYIDDPETPSSVRAFLEHARAPAHGMGLGKRPPLYADYDGRRVRIVMASRFGDVGFNFSHAESGYDKRLYLESFKNFSDRP